MQKLYSIDSLEALKISIQCETDMKVYYEKAASLVKNDDAEAILKGLGKKREGYKAELMRLYGKVSGKKILYLNLGKKHKLSTLQRCPDDPNDAVRIAKKNELELKKFFLPVSRRLVEPELRQFFRGFVQRQEQNLFLLESSFEEPLMLDQEQAEGENISTDISIENSQVNVW